MNASNSTLTVPVNDDDHIRGNPDAAVVVVEYGDYECPYCAKAHPLVKQLQERYGDDLCVVFRHFPLTQMHQLAGPAAEVAEGAASLGKFWAVHDWLYDNHELWTSEGPQAFGQGLRELDIDQSEVASAIESGEPGALIEQDLKGGMASGVNSTPSFFINGQLFDGDYRALGQQVEAAMAAGR